MPDRPPIPSHGTRPSLLPPPIGSDQAGATGRSTGQALPGRSAPKPNRTQGGRSALSSVVVTVLAGFVGLTVVGLALGARSIVDPKAPDFLGVVLPSWVSGPVNEHERTVTQAQIRALIAQQGLLAGEPIEILAGDWLVVTATQAQRPCLAGGSSCWPIQQLRIYRHQKQPEAGDRAKLYRLVSQAAVTGLEPSSVLAPFGAAASQERRAGERLPLTRVEVMAKPAPNEGIWLNLSGQYEGKAATALYGSVVYFNPGRAYQSVMLNWSSPRGLAPVWRNVLGDAQPELLIDRGLGAAVDLAVYRLQPYRFAPNPRRFEAIALDPPALNRSDYRNALSLARSGLWSPALSRLSALANELAQKGQPFSPAAQAQLDLVRQNALVAQTRADDGMKNRSIQIQAALLDGRWQRAIDLFRQAGPVERSAAINQLKADAPVLWHRLKVYLALEPKDPAAKTWGAIVRSLTDGAAAAWDWYNDQPGNTASLTHQIKLELGRVAAVVR